MTKESFMKKYDNARRHTGYIFILIFCLLVAGVSAAGIYSYQKLKLDFRAEVERQLSAIAELKVADLQRQRQAWLNDAAVFYKNAAFSILVKRYLEHPENQQAKNQLQIWLSQIQSSHKYDRVMLLDPHYTKKMIMPDSLERSISYVSPSSSEILKSGKIVIEDFYWNEQNRRIYLKILTPIIDESHGGQVIGILVMRVDPEIDLYPLITRWPTDSQTAETLLVRQEGNSMLYLNELRFQKNTALRLRIPLDNNKVLAVKAVQGLVGIAEGEDYRGEKIVAALNHIPDSPWFMVARMDISEAFGPMKKQLQERLLMAALLLLCIGTALGFIWHQQEARFYRNQHRATEALQESEARLCAITNSAQDAILTMNPEALLTFWNPAAERILGYSSAEALGQNLHDLIAPQRYHEAHHAAFPGFLRTGQGSAIGKTVHLHATRKDGREITVAMSLSSVQMRDGWHAVGILRDITELKQAQDNLEQANHSLETSMERANQMAFEAQAANIAKSQFLANMSHEIRTPMNGVIGMTGLLLMSGLTDEQRRYAETASLSAHALLSIINDILDFSKIEANKLELEIMDFDLRLTFEDAAELLALRAQDKGLEFICRIHPDVYTFLRGDPGRLRQILINLGNNAIKFTSHGEVVIEVAVELETDDQLKIRVEVRDTGIGIPQEKIALLFTAFQQADASTTRRFGGTGLGLAISKRLVEIMSGEIGIESTEGRGSTFWFTAVFAKQTRRDQRKILPLSNLRGMKILVVDDNATNRLVVAEQLASWGVLHEEADTAENAMRLLRAARAAEDPFRIMILDMQMPDTDGESLGKSVKADAELKDTLLVMMSSLGTRGDAKRLKALGFSAYLTKPVKQSQFYDCLATVLSGSTAPAKIPEPVFVTRHTLHEARQLRAQILLAEDNLTNQCVALGILGKLGFSADIANNGREALEALEKTHYDIVLMDVQMPEMDGFEATQAIRSGKTKVLNSKIHIIAMTAHAMKGDHERCLEAGMDDYLSKPIEPQVLAAALIKWGEHAQRGEGIANLPAV
jgi:PAS domain S-box-containing protein